ncbi:hypothetical protein F2Q69_00059616 [Brassica cretica]|uniref:Retrotransposon gag domain-containing protein n=1 Tax=Brassica cretica TaxID=69181 RepID=A0A8S9RDL6_BRACR|nr:hypothetical protein F2Q69_00059616 [Brassica cretica]
MPRKFSFLNIMRYDGSDNPDDHIAQYKQRMLAVALIKESREATMCKGFCSTLIGPVLQWYINLPSRSISSFAILSDKFLEQFACRRNMEKTSDGLYEILKHRAEPLRGYIARFSKKRLRFPSVMSVLRSLPSREAYSPTGTSTRNLPNTSARPWKTPDQNDRDERPSPRSIKDPRNRNQGRYQNQPLEKAEGMAVSTWPDISHLSISKPELVNVLRQMDQQVKWPQKMKAPDSFRNPGLWCDFHRDHGHKTEDGVALRIEVTIDL